MSLIRRLFSRNAAVKAHVNTPQRTELDQLWRQIRLANKAAAMAQRRADEAFNKGNSAHVAVSRLKSDIAATAMPESDDLEAAAVEPLQLHTQSRSNRRAGMSMRSLTRGTQTKPTRPTEQSWQDAETNGVNAGS